MVTRFTRAGKAGLAAAAALSLLTALLAAPASAADTGLLGSQDATYDGVFRQSLAISGLAAVDARIPDAAIEWLKDQQCADGSFEAYRDNTATRCGASDPDAFSGPDTNSTAMAATALFLAGEQTEARKAVTWLISTQNDDFGFPFYAGGESDANSTGLALVALQTVQPQDRSARIPNAKKFLGTVKLKCASGGGFAYQQGSTANGLATAQGYMGLAGALPVDSQGSLAADPVCKKRDTTSNAGGFLASAIKDDGAVQSDFGSGADYTSTGWAILGLIANGVGASAVDSGVETLEDNARSYVFADGEAVPGAAGLMMLVAEASGSNPRSFGGVNLITAVTGSMQ